MQPAKIDSNLAVAFEFEVIAPAAYDDKCHMDCMADGADAGVDYRNYCSATYHYCSNPSYCSGAFDCMLASSMWDTCVDRLAAPNDGSRSLDNLRVKREM